jgi:hypothetical protein
MAFAQQKSVPLRVLGNFRVQVQDAEIQRRGDFHHGKGRPGVPLSPGRDHFDNVLSDRYRFSLQFIWTQVQTG